MLQASICERMKLLQSWQTRPRVVTFDHAQCKCQNISHGSKHSYQILRYLRCYTYLVKPCFLIVTDLEIVFKGCLCEQGLFVLVFIYLL